MRERPFFGLEVLECGRLRSLSDVIEVARLLQDLGLLPAAGPPWTTESHPEPVTDLDEFLAGRERRTKESRPRAGSLLSMWGLPLLRPEFPDAFNTMRVLAWHPDVWEVGVFLSTECRLSAGGQPIDISASSGALLEQVGAALYQRARPALAVIIARGFDEYVDFARAVGRRRLLVGWRTWFGPPYVEAFGRDWLARLPDATAPLDDGGVFHRLAAPVRALTTGDPGAYAGVLAFLRAQGVRPTWPRASAAPSRQRRQEVGLGLFRQMLLELLGTSFVLTDGRRVTFLPLAWAPLSTAQRRVALATIREAAERELAADPDALIHFEFSEVPAELDAMLAELVQQQPRLSYALVSQQTPS